MNKQELTNVKGLRVRIKSGKAGVVYDQIVDIDDSIRVLFDDSDHPNWISISRLTAVLVAEPETVSTSKEGWNFKVSAIQAIDWARMENDLSTGKPLLSVTVDIGGDSPLNLVMVQRALLDKANACKIKTPTSPKNMIDGAPNVFEVRNHIAEWVTWGKKVKAAAWPKGLRCTATVTAQQISV